MRRIAMPDGGTLAVRETGEGQALLLAPGLGGLGSFFDAIAPRLAERFRVVTYDHRGVGESAGAPGPVDVAGMAGDARAVLDALGVARAHVLGHSLGGAIAQRLALDAPERVGRLVLSATFTHADAYVRRLFELRLALLEALGAGWQARAATLFQHAPEAIRDGADAFSAREAAAEAADGPLPREILAARIRALLAFDSRAELALIRAPTLVVAARDDRTIPAYFADALAAAIPAARLALLPDGGHFPPATRPAAFLAAVEPFLAEP